MTTTCPGCGLELAAGTQGYERKFNASAECWSVFEEVLAKEFQSAPLFGQVHQLTVDAFAVQHAGGRHPDKSVCIHLVGLHLNCGHPRFDPKYDDHPRERGWSSWTDDRD